VAYVNSVPGKIHDSASFQIREIGNEETLRLVKESISFELKLFDLYMPLLSKM